MASRELLDKIYPNFQGEVKECKRCGEVLPEDWIPEPLVICLLCYKNLPGNKHLWDDAWPQESLMRLRQKATKSRWAKSRKESSTRKQLLHNLARSYGAGVISFPTESNKDEIVEPILPNPEDTCERCGKVSQFYEARAVEGGIKIICHECIPPTPITTKRR